MEGNGLDKHPELKDIRLHTIETLCGSNYIAPDVGPFEGGIEAKTPQSIFEISMLYKRMHDELYRFSNAMRINREAFLEGLYLEKSVATTGRTVFSSLFNLLDFVCYWHDKNHAARLYDSSHAYFAQYCDVLVSNDKRMRIKTEAVYSYLGIGTRVCTADEFLKGVITGG